MAQPFDATLRQFAGDPFPIVDQHRARRQPLRELFGLRYWCAGLREWARAADDAPDVDGPCGPRAEHHRRRRERTRASRYRLTIGASPSSYRAAILKIGTSGLWTPCAARRHVSRSTPATTTRRSGLPTICASCFKVSAKGSSTLRQKRVDGTTKEEILLRVRRRGRGAALLTGRQTAGTLPIAGASQGPGGLRRHLGPSALRRSEAVPAGEDAVLERRTPSSHPTIGGSRINRMRAARCRSTSSRFPPTGGKFQVSKDGGIACPSGGETARSCFSCRQTRR